MKLSGPLSFFRSYAKFPSSNVVRAFSNQFDNNGFADHLLALEINENQLNFQPCIWDLLYVL